MIKIGRSVFVAGIMEERKALLWDVSMIGSLRRGRASSDRSYGAASVIGQKTIQYKYKPEGLGDRAGALWLA